MFKDKKWSNRIQLILLLVIFSAPLLGAYFYKLYLERNGESFKTVNVGELYYQPKDLPDISFTDSSGNIQSFNSFEKKWYIVVVADKSCDESCEQALNKIARIRAMQGKNLHRIVSLFVHRGLTKERSDWLAKTYTVTGVSPQNPDELEQWLQPFYQARGQASFDSTRIYLIDPLKKLMMSYPADVDPKGIFKDLKRLLKVSQVG